MLYEISKTIDLENCLQSKKDFLPIPKYEDRKSWNEVNEETKGYYIGVGSKLKNKKWDSLPASLYMDFKRNGNRSNYEKICFERRKELFELTIAECIEHKQNYIDDIINGLWLICEETSWVIPAHNNKRGDGVRIELPDIEDKIYIDLFSAETASLLAWIYYILGDEIEKTSPLTKRRVEIEINKRIIEPFEKYDDYWYLGLIHNEPVNNWNPWIISNILPAILVFVEDKKQRVNLVEKTIKSSDRFLAFYAKDGGCDEGPGYFNVAGASFFDYLEELYYATNEKLNVFDNEIIQNMLKYIYRVYIGNNCYVNYADAAPKLSVAANMLTRAGKYINDEDLIGFSKKLIKDENVKKQYIAGQWQIFRTLKDILQKDDDKKYDFKIPKSHWFKGINVMTARDFKDSTKGMFVSAKGGNNGESHNHNDVGNFILYYDGNPVIIDVGVEQYTSKTFSNERYSIWTMQSSYHNLPTLNGYDQIAGEENCANNVEYFSDNINTRLSLEASKAYPTNAKVDTFKRIIDFQHENNVTIRDNYITNKENPEYIMNIMCYNKPIKSGNNIIFNEIISMPFDDNLFDCVIEEIKLTDKKIITDWEKDSLYRLRLVCKAVTNENEFTFKFTKK